MSKRKALQLHRPEIVQLLTLSLGEEQNAGQLLDQVTQPLMSGARMPASFEYMSALSRNAAPGFGEVSE
jgi:hypothetical protein